ncbi:MAG: TetR/AcrR family transcriptional regulator C-terminal domain-containing protein [Candidatus Borkfalkiaceae bacterium]|nr:TetR/AcrR family transcriptional regulator C-terminal domain-containing protein [Christensenellaceae bacterium]
MNKSESKYYNTACLMDEAFILLLEKKEFQYITVKEICTKAGVNRSTFYLHYETMNDLLEESAQFVLKKFYESMQSVDDFNIAHGEEGINEFVTSSSLDNLYLITPKYLTPYLQFIRDNKRLYATALKNVGLFKWENTYDNLFKKIFSPILDRFGQEEKIKPYLVLFYISGLMAIVTEWLKNDCAESVEEIISVIEVCMNR